MAEDLPNEDEWVDLEKPNKFAPITADVAISMSAAKLRSCKGGKPSKKPAPTTPRVYLSFRGEAAQWVRESGPRFRVQVAGPKANRIRIVPDLHQGKFEGFKAPTGDVMRMVLSGMTMWPNEDRAPVELEWDCSKNWMVLTLPDDFATPRTAPPATPPKVVGGRAA